MYHSSKNCPRGDSRTTNASSHPSPRGYPQRIQESFAPSFPASKSAVNGQASMAENNRQTRCANQLPPPAPVPDFIKVWVKQQKEKELALNKNNGSGQASSSLSNRRDKSVEFVAEVKPDSGYALVKTPTKRDGMSRTTADYTRPNVIAESLTDTECQSVKLNG
ncbi:Zinc finger, CCHC-type [Caenorhabditis elegans]|uniref:Zinc finger, CCHC-type n=1 Tax=Caenorhabditis elegans TaxID=6239 RepID=Q18108_CAEEL|nr:Zinc finger, CCHC-type [Caenorhabditis elegans]CCD65282.2 Zinc finger, CCHC-type [Caenorhabditis elegans]